MGPTGRVLQPALCILDEIDSGLDVDALGEVARRLQLATTDWDVALLAITHFNRFLVQLEADLVHVMVRRTPGGQRRCGPGARTGAHRLRRLSHPKVGRRCPDRCKAAWYRKQPWHAVVAVATSPASPAEVDVTSRTRAGWRHWAPRCGAEPAAMRWPIWLDCSRWATASTRAGNAGDRGGGGGRPGAKWSSRCCRWSRWWSCWSARPPASCTTSSTTWPRGPVPVAPQWPVVRPTTCWSSARIRDPARRPPRPSSSAAPPIAGRPAQRHHQDRPRRPADRDREHAVHPARHLRHPVRCAVRVGRLQQEQDQRGVRGRPERPTDQHPTVTGANGLVKTIENTFGIPISHWIVVNFFGLMDAVNALGGVNMALPYKGGA